MKSLIAACGVAALSLISFSAISLEPGVVKTAAVVETENTADRMTEAPAPQVTGTDRHVTYQFTLSPGQSHSFPLPIASSPVRLSAAFEYSDSGTQSPSALIAAVIAQDRLSGQVTWIGTNGDGSQAAGNTISGSTVASFAYSNAILTAASSVGGKVAVLTLMFSSGGSTAATFRVTMDY